MTDAVAIAIISSGFSFAGLVVVALVKRDQNKLHKQINSRMDELLALTRKEGKAEGIKQEKDKKN